MREQVQVKLVPTTNCKFLSSLTSILIAKESSKITSLTSQIQIKIRRLLHNCLQSHLIFIAYKNMELIIRDLLLEAAIIFQIYFPKLPMGKIAYQSSLTPYLISYQTILHLSNFQARINCFDGVVHCLSSLTYPRILLH